jgi:hypothetical protein
MSRGRKYSKGVGGRAISIIIITESLISSSYRGLKEIWLTLEKTSSK